MKDYECISYTQQIITLDLQITNYQSVDGIGLNKLNICIYLELLGMFSGTSKIFIVRRKDLYSIVSLKIHLDLSIDFTVSRNHTMFLGTTIRVDGVVCLQSSGPVGGLCRSDVKACVMGCAPYSQYQILPVSRWATLASLQQLIFLCNFFFISAFK